MRHLVIEGVRVRNSIDDPGIIEVIVIVPDPRTYLKDAPHSAVRMPKPVTNPPKIRVKRRGKQSRRKSL